jgi:hypothetical protein
MAFRLPSAGIFILSLTVAILVAVAIWIASEAAYENMRFARATDQTLSLVTVAQEAASKDPKFAQDTNENLIEELWRRGLITPNAPQPPVLKNIWSGDTRVTVSQPLIMRIETDVPTRACRQLGIFFGGIAPDLGVQVMQARGVDGTWRQFYSASSGVRSIGDNEVNAACGSALGSATLALELRLR